jgi:hypothetical protein
MLRSLAQRRLLRISLVLVAQRHWRTSNAHRQGWIHGYEHSPWIWWNGLWHADTSPRVWGLGRSLGLLGIYLLLLYNRHSRRLEEAGVLLYVCPQNLMRNT